MPLMRHFILVNMTEWGLRLNIGEHGLLLVSVTKPTRLDSANINYSKSTCRLFKANTSSSWHSKSLWKKSFKSGKCGKEFGVICVIKNTNALNMISWGQKKKKKAFFIGN